MSPLVWIGVMAAAVLAGASLVDVFAGRRRTRRRVAAERASLADPMRDGAPADGSPTTSTRLRRAADDLAAGVGGGLRRVARRPTDRVADARLGRGVLVAAMVAALFGPTAAAVAGGLVILTPRFRARASSRRSDAAIRAELPEVVDLLALAVGAGLNLHLAVVAVTRIGDGPVTDALAVVGRRVAAGERLADALGALQVLGEPSRPLLDALVAAERHGAPLRTALERIGAETRMVRRRRHEEAARKLPVRLLFPLVLCTLPALGLLTVVPLVATSLPSSAP